MTQKTSDRISLRMSVAEAIATMSEGNPGAVDTLCKLLIPNNIDPDSALGGWGAMLLLDTFGIYGSSIYVLYNDICNRSLPHMLAVLRAVQMGLFSGYTLKSASDCQDYSGKSIVPVEDLYRHVKERLPNFHQTPQ